MVVVLARAFLRAHDIMVIGGSEMAGIASDPAFREIFDKVIETRPQPGRRRSGRLRPCHRIEAVTMERQLSDVVIHRLEFNLIRRGRLMGSYNILHATTTCPRTGEVGPVEIEFTFGLLDFRDYHVSDTIDWGVEGLRSPRQRPVGGNFEGGGYVECPVCHKDYWVRITVRADVITDVRVDTSSPGHIP